MNYGGNHDFRNSSSICKCGVTEEALQDGVASIWCTEFQPTPLGRVGMIAHWTAIVLLVGGPLAGLIAPEPGAGQFVLAAVIGLAAMLVAELHAGLFDEIVNNLDAMFLERLHDE